MHPLIAALAIALAAAPVGCKESDSSAPPPSGRVNAVHGKAAPKPAAADPASFCDVQHGASGPKLALPELAEPVADSPAGSWRWVNLWATWCKPCVEELPRLQSWTAILARRGAPVDLVLVSVDEDADTVAAFVKKHSGFAGSGRIADPEAATPFLVSAGLDEGAPLPVHILVDPEGAIRCLRSGAIAERDFASVAALLGR